MNILITGMNKNQCTKDFYLSQQLKVVPSHYSLIRCLEDMGHLVTQRHVEIGETLSEFDEVIVFLHNTSSFSGFLYNALWAIHKKPCCIFAFDDWQTDSIYNSISDVSDMNKLFREYVKSQHKHIPNNIESYKDEFSHALSVILSKSNRMLMSAFSGGDLSLLIDYPSELLFSYNPNPYHLNRKPSVKIDQYKERVFNFAGLVQDKTKKWLKDQGVDNKSWPLKKYGSRKDGQDRVTEDVMVDIYNQQWGILMAGYFHAGSGWWRARPLQCADAGSILIGDPKEMIIYYKDDSLYNLRALDLISMTDTQLEQVAHTQKEMLYKNHPLNKDVQKSELDKCIKY